MNKIPLYNNLGYAIHQDTLGNDLRICEAARHSFGDPASKGEEADKKLIGYLMANKHTSPFEQCSMTWQLRMPIYVMRQFVRHRTFRLNEESARYTEMRDDFYVPKEWRAQAVKDKQGSVAAELNHEELTRLVEESCRASYAKYLDLLRAGVAREQARMILPVNLMTTIVVNIDLNNLMKFFVLRLDSHAQWEIRVLASAMLDGFFKAFPVTANHFAELVLRPNKIYDVPIEELNLY